MVRQRSIAVLMLTMLLAVAGRGAAAPVRAAKSTTKPAVKTAASAPLQTTSATPAQIFGAYWEVSPGYSTTLILQNKDPQNSVAVNVLLFSGNGLMVAGSTPGATAQLQLAAKGTQQVSLGSLLPADGATHEGGLALQFDATVPSVTGQVVITSSSNGTSAHLPLSSGYALDTENALYAPWWLGDAGTDGNIELFNSSSQAIVVTPSVTVQGVEQAGSSVNLGPSASQEVSLRTLLGQVNASSATIGFLTLRYTGPAHALQPALVLANSTSGFWMNTEFHARHNQTTTTTTGTAPINTAGITTASAPTPAAAPTRWQFADLKLQWSGTSNPLHGYALLSNGTKAPMDLELEAHFATSQPKDPMQKVRLPVAPLAPLETRLVDLSQFVISGTITGNPSRVGLVASHPGAPGDLAINLFSVNPDNTLAFPSPGGVMSSSVVDVSYWEVGNKKESPKAVRNPTSTPQQGQVILYYPIANGVGSYEFPVMQLPANSDPKITLGQITRVPDVHGVLAPKGTKSGLATLVTVPAGGAPATAAAEMCQPGCQALSASVGNTATSGPLANDVIITQHFHIHFNQHFNQTCNAPIMSLSPDSGKAGETVSVSISGEFLPQDFTIDAGDEIIVMDAVWQSENLITAEFEMPDAPSTNSWPVTVSGPDGVSNSATFSLAAPSLQSISPPSGNAGDVVSVTLSGEGFPEDFTVDAGDEIIVMNVMRVDANTITADFEMPDDPAASSWQVTVTDDFGDQSSPVFFSLQPPTITSTNLDLGGKQAGQNVPVIINGTSFSLSATVDAGNDITVSNVIVTSNQRITATFQIPLNATGSHSITVTNAAGPSNPWSFTVNPAKPPTIEPIVPASGTAGTTVDITIGGGIFRQGDQVIVGGGITVSNVKVVDQNTITATFQLPLCGPFGTQQVSINDPQVGPSTNSSPFTVNAPAPPQVTGVSPDPWQAGFSNVPVTIQGTGFGCNPSLQITDPNNAISYTAAVVASTDPTTGEATSIQTEVSIDPADGPESATVEVFNNDGSGASFSSTTTRTSTMAALLESPPFLVPVKAVPPKPLIILAKADASGSGATACSNNPQDISSSKKNVVAGQQIALIACINKLPQGFTIQNESWTMPSGAAVAGFTNGAPGSTKPDDTKGQDEAITPPQCGTETNCVLPPFYWLCPSTSADSNTGGCKYPGDDQITFQYQVTDGTNTQSVSATAKFSIGGPTVNSVTTQMLPTIVTPVTDPTTGTVTVALSLGPGSLGTPPQNVFGITITESGNNFPNGSGATANYQWVQLITSLQFGTLTQKGKTTYTADTSNNFQLDTVYPQFPTQGQQPSSNTIDFDTPRVGLGTGPFALASEVSESFTARAWLMWDPALNFDGSGCQPAFRAPTSDAETPSTCDSIPIPIGYVEWHFSGDALNTLDLVTPPTDTQGWRAGAPDGQPGCGNPDQPIGDVGNGQPPGPAFVPQPFTFPHWTGTIKASGFPQNLTCSGVACSP